MLRDNKAVQWLFGGVLLLLNGWVFVSALMMDESKISPLLIGVPIGLLALYGLMIFFIGQIKQPKLGVYGQWIILVDGKERIGMVEANRFQYSQTIYIADDVHIAARNGSYISFDIEEIEKYLAPLLPHAQKLSQLKVGRYLWDKRDKPFLLGLVLIPVVLVALIFR